MATVHPSLEGFQPLSLGQSRELAVIRQLVDGLPGDYAVFHSVMWSAVQGNRQWFGEIDAIVLAPNGHLLLIEVKAGPVEFSAYGISKRYDDKRKDVLGQLQLQHASIRQRLKEEDLRDVSVAQLLVLPDVVVAASSTVAYPRQRIVDRDEFRWLADKVMAVLVPEDENNPLRFERLRRFLMNLYGLHPDPTARIGWLNQAVQSLSDGLATWVPRISNKNGRYLIHATAGSGKTQLAIRLLQKAQGAGLRVNYCCFNRPLADHLRAALPLLADQIHTFHELAIAAWRPQQVKPDFAKQETFAAASQFFCQQTAESGTLDLLIIDEAQDFSPEWISALLRRRKPDGRVYVLQDEDQRLYQRGEWATAEVLDSPVEIVSWDNFRSPRRLVETMNALGLAEHPIVARCPVAGDTPGFHVWEEGDASGMVMLEQVVRSLLAEGIAPEQIALLSFTGRERSALLHRAVLADKTLRRFAGSFDANGHASWHEGSLLAETLFRFKGQAAPVVVLCEIDFATLDTATRHRLFVGMTRAQWRLECVLSPRAAGLLAERIAES